MFSLFYSVFSWPDVVKELLALELPLLVTGPMAARPRTGLDWTAQETWHLNAFDLRVYFMVDQWTLVRDFSVIVWLNTMYG